MTTTVPEATTGAVTVTTAQGTATSPQAFAVTTTQDFTVQALPGSVQLLQGTSTTSTVSLLSDITPFTGLATLAVSGLRSGMTASFAPAATVSGGQLRTLTIAATLSAAVGAATLTITASAPIDGATVTRSTNAALTVMAGGRTAALGQEEW